MNKKYPMSLFELLGILLAAQLVLLSGLLVVLGILWVGHLLELADAAWLGWLVAGGANGFLLFIVYGMLKGKVLLWPSIIHSEGRLDPELPPEQLLLGGLKWGVFCCTLPLQNLIRKAWPE